MLSLKPALATLMVAGALAGGGAAIASAWRRRARHPAPPRRRRSRRAARHPQPDRALRAPRARRTAAPARVARRPARTCRCACKTLARCHAKAGTAGSRRSRRGLAVAAPHGALTGLRAWACVVGTLGARRGPCGRRAGGRDVGGSNNARSARRRRVGWGRCRSPRAPVRSRCAEQLRRSGRATARGRAPPPTAKPGSTPS